jgi:hypothetical protein
MWYWAGHQLLNEPFLGVGGGPAADGTVQVDRFGWRVLTRSLFRRVCDGLVARPPADRHGDDAVLT